MTCPECRGTPRTPAPQSRAAQIAALVGMTTLVGGERRLILPCECGVLMIAGIDHTCDPADRRAQGVPLD